MPTTRNRQGKRAGRRNIFEARFPVVFQASNDKSGDPVKFRGVAYSGGTFPQWFGTVCIDLAGMEPLPEGKALGLLLNHGMVAANPRVGVVRSLTKSSAGVVVEGTLLANETAAEIVADAALGYPFEMSLQTLVLERREIAAGERATVNGREISGPCTVATRSVVREVSVTELGADRVTRFALAATAGGPMPEESEDNEDEENSEEHPMDETKEDQTKNAVAPVPDTKARLAQIRAIAGNDDALILKAFEAGWDDVAILRAMLDRANARIAESDRALSEAREQLKISASAAGAAPVPGGPPPNTEHGFAGALGKNPSHDWDASANLRAHWSKTFGGDEIKGRDAFMRYAGGQRDRGEPWLDPV